MSKAANIVAQESFGKAVNTNNLEEIRNLVAHDCIDHDPAPGQIKGPHGYIALFQQMISAFPDFAIDVERLVADEDNVAFAYTITGTHRGEFFGVPPTGRKIRARGLQISRFNSDSKMIERWGSSDQLGILQQLGAA